MAIQSFLRRKNFNRSKNNAVEQFCDELSIGNKSLAKEI